MTRWDTKVPCPQRKCEGTLEAYEGDEKRSNYMFICTQCSLQGEWKRMARAASTVRRLNRK